MWEKNSMWTANVFHSEIHLQWTSLQSLFRIIKHQHMKVLDLGHYNMDELTAQVVSGSWTKRTQQQNKSNL